MLRGTKVTSGDLQQDLLIEQGQSIVIVGILVVNEAMTSVLVNFQDNEGNSLFPIVCPAQDSERISWSFLADRGLKAIGLSSDGDKVHVAVWHSGAGA